MFRCEGERSKLLSEEDEALEGRPWWVCMCWSAGDEVDILCAPSPEGISVKDKSEVPWHSVSLPLFLTLSVSSSYPPAVKSVFVDEENFHSDITGVLQPTACWFSGCCPPSGVEALAVVVAVATAGRNRAMLTGDSKAATLEPLDVFWWLGLWKLCWSNTTLSVLFILLFTPLRFPWQFSLSSDPGSGSRYLVPEYSVDTVWWLLWWWNMYTTEQRSEKWLTDWLTDTHLHLYCVPLSPTWVLLCSHTAASGIPWLRSFVGLLQRVLGTEYAPASIT